MIGDRFAVALYRYIVGEAGDWDRQTDAGRHAALDLVVAVHGASAEAARDACIDGFVISSRVELVEALRELERSWGTEPFAEPTRALLSKHVGAIEHALARYDALVLLAQERPERMVLTHGEPHAANLIETADGFVLIDWDLNRYLDPRHSTIPE